MPGNGGPETLMLKVTPCDDKMEGDPAGVQLMSFPGVPYSLCSMGVLLTSSRELGDDIEERVWRVN